MTVVKATGYGHGLVAVSRQALVSGAAFCGIASVDEALELRRAGVEEPMLA